MSNTKRLLSDHDSCPHCGNVSMGYYLKVQYQGSYEWEKNFDGSDRDNSNAYDNINQYGGTMAYCRLCDGLIGRNDL